jgi:hypothetical protein
MRQRGEKRKRFLLLPAVRHRAQNRIGLRLASQDGGRRGADATASGTNLALEDAEQWGAHPKSSSRRGDCRGVPICQVVQAQRQSAQTGIAALAILAT